MANGNGSSEASPLWYAVGCIVLILAVFGGLAWYKPLQFTPAKPAGETTCEGADCGHAAPPAASHAAPAPRGE